MTAPTWTPPGPQAGDRPARPRWVAPAAVGAATVCGCAAIALIDPGDSGTAVCWSQSLFGIDCPLCGGLRCVNALVRGDWAAAADHNVLLAIALPLLAVAWAVWLVRSLRDRPAPDWMRRLAHPSVAVGVGVGVFLLAFTVVRNVGGPEWAEWLNSAAFRS